MFQCCKCEPGKNLHPRGISYFRQGEMVEYCRVHDPANRAALVAARNVFEGFELAHVKDENGKRIKVNSLKELREKEKQYNFYLNCATDANGDTSEAPQHEKGAGNIARDYRWKWARDEKERERILAREAEKGKGTTVGTVMNPNETLAYRPNPL
jgi:hypothetical protein